MEKNNKITTMFPGGARITTEVVDEGVQFTLSKEIIMALGWGLRSKEWQLRIVDDHATFAKKLEILEV